jgi:hypothetical protein
MPTIISIEIDVLKRSKRKAKTRSNKHRDIDGSLLTLGFQGAIFVDDHGVITEADRCCGNGRRS